MTPDPAVAATIGELRASGHRDRTVKEELRENLLGRLVSGEQLFPSIIGFDESSRFYRASV